MENLVGQKIDQYQIERHLATGGMADVYLARDVGLNRPVALKVMLSGLIHNKELTARFQREAQVIARLEHPNIIQIYTTGLTPDKQPYLAMQYIAGGSLQDELTHLVDSGKLLSPDRVLRIGRQVADALQTAHAVGVVHRDLKPSNIMMQTDGTAVVTDLGIAAVQHTSARLTQTGHMMGTPYYMSPEQAFGEQVDGRADIYALGIVLYEMLSGSVPFTADSPLAVLHQQLYDQPQPLMERRSGLSNVTYQLVEICLQKDPANRYQSAAHLHAALSQALQAESGILPTEMLMTPTGERAIIPSDRRQLPPWLLYAGGAVVVIILVGVFLWPRPNNSEGEQSQAGASQGVAASTTTIIATRIATAAALPSATIFPTITTATTAPLPTDTAVPPTATSTTLPTPTFAATVAPIIAANVNAPYFNVPIVIDGNLNEWGAVTPVLAAYRTFEDPSWDGSDDLTAVWRVAWDDNNLYVAVTVVDDIHAQNRTGNLIYQGDSIDLQLDTDRLADLSDSWSNDDYQITMSPGNFNNLPPSVFRWTANDEGRLENAPNHNIILTAQQTGSGYVIEATIPWQDFNITPVVGLVLGAAFNASDNDQVGTAVQEVLYSHVATRTLLSPNSWGTLTLTSGN